MCYFAVNQQKWKKRFSQIVSNYLFIFKHTRLFKLNFPNSQTSVQSNMTHNDLKFRKLTPEIISPRFIENQYRNSSMDETERQKILVLHIRRGYAELYKISKKCDLQLNVISLNEFYDHARRKKCNLTNVTAHT